MKRIIKKYPNRRLYDTKKKVYITLDDVKTLVIEHEDIQVIDANTKKDLTQMTLLQIITENETSTTPMFTIPMLQHFIRLYHEKSQHLMSQYLEEVMGLFANQKELMSKQWQSYQQEALEKMPWWPLSAAKTTHTPRSVNKPKHKATKK